MNRWLGAVRDLLSGGRWRAWQAPRVVWRVRLRLDPRVVYVAAEDATDAVLQACNRLRIQPDTVISAERYDAPLDVL